REVGNALDEYPSVAGGNVKYGHNLSQNLFHLLQEADSLGEEFQDEFLSTEIVLLALMKLKYYRLPKYLMQQRITEK
ncbi:hypothetical protein ACQ1ZW_16100, partial [Enterococcus faecalis]|uniref:hypothetical protein n=1 Tax=Enterococcus faecalis TaxID=1351 RepID=UPI003D6ACE8A